MLYKGFLLLAIGISLQLNAQKFISVKDINPDHFYLSQKEVLLSVNLDNPLPKLVSGILKVEVRSDFKEDKGTKTEKVKISKHGKISRTIVLGPMAPGFYKAIIVLDSPVTQDTLIYDFGVDPEKIVSPTDRPADFDDYWLRAKRELAAVDPQFKMIKVDSLCTDKKDAYLVEMRSLGNVLIRGWYSVPKKPGKYPAMLHVQGYSSVNIYPYTYSGDDMVSFALNIRGHGNSKDDVNPGFPGYFLYFINDKEQYIYRGAYMDCRRAVDFLFSRPEVDTTMVIVEGGSQGGALSFATAALNNDRIRLCVPHVPFLSDFRDYFKIADWPANEVKGYLQKHSEVSSEQVYNTLSYIDIKNLAPWINAPVLMTIGLRDIVCPPHINFAAYNQLHVPRQYKVYPYSGHGMPQEYYSTVKYNWIKSYLGLSTPLHN